MEKPVHARGRRKLDALEGKLEAKLERGRRAIGGALGGGGVAGAGALACRSGAPMGSQRGDMGPVMPSSPASRL